MTTEHLNALKSIARQCSDELKFVNHKDLEAIKAIIEEYEKQAAPLGFSGTHLRVEIGYLNGRFVDRRQ